MKKSLILILIFLVRICVFCQNNITNSPSVDTKQNNITDNINNNANPDTTNNNVLPNNISNDDNIPDNIPSDGGHDALGGILQEKFDGYSDVDDGIDGDIDDVSKQIDKTEKLLSQMAINIINQEAQKTLWHYQKNVNVVPDDDFAFNIKGKDLQILCHFVLHIDEDKDSYFLVSNIEINYIVSGKQQKSVDLRVLPIKINENIEIYPIGRNRENIIQINIEFKK